MSAANIALFERLTATASSRPAFVTKPGHNAKSGTEKFKKGDSGKKTPPPTAIVIDTPEPKIVPGCDLPELVSIARFPVVATTPRTSGQLGRRRASRMHIRARASSRNLFPELKAAPVSDLTHAYIADTAVTTDTEVHISSTDVHIISTGAASSTLPKSSPRKVAHKDVMARLGQAPPPPVPPPTSNDGKAAVTENEGTGEDVGVFELDETGEFGFGFPEEDLADQVTSTGVDATPTTDSGSVHEPTKDLGTQAKTVDAKTVARDSSAALALVSQSSLEGWLLKLTGTSVFGKRYKKRYIQVQGTMLKVYVTNPTPGDTAESYVNIDSSSEVRHTSERGISLFTEKKTIHLVAESGEDAKVWVRFLGNVCKAANGVSDITC